MRFIFNAAPKQKVSGANISKKVNRTRANGVCAAAGRMFNGQSFGYLVNSYGKERSFVTCFVLL
jgi:hypothetical protein